MRRIVSCETPQAAATMRSGSFCSTTRCTTVGHSEAGRPYAGCFGPGRMCLITTGGVLPSAVSSSASRRRTLRYSFPDGARKREKIGDRVVETRRFWFDYLCIFLVLLQQMFFRFNVSSLCWLSCTCLLTHALPCCSADSSYAYELGNNKPSAPTFPSSSLNSYTTWLAQPSIS